MPTIEEPQIAPSPPVELPAKPPMPQRADICGDRASSMWREFKNEKPTRHTFWLGIMTNVKFERQFTPVGCLGEFSGHAIGTLEEGAVPTKEMLARARPLVFASCSGMFHDKRTGKPLFGASVLILGPHLHGEYIP